MPLQHLIYVSTARQELSHAEQEALLESCVRHNLQNDISGVLLYGPGNFIQVLEGEAAAVAETYQRILDDPRHHNLIEILLEDIEQRSFSNWRMGFTRLDDDAISKHPGFIDVYGPDFLPQRLAQRPTLAMNILLSFRANCR
ncbi:BLUF domain-containing protein [Chromobacterium subtsugae]|uniref:BLUF domain-containing protein n=1 Tax=Chromobacterium subtsugae TaxID=251747 RepID=UPI00069CB381|nr:BLUF domain-containing protein [Chromobacterium subtsugae]